MFIPRFAREIACSAGSRERMTSEESRQARRHHAWILHVQQMRRIRENESLDFRQPGEQKFLPLAEDRRDLRTHIGDLRRGGKDGENG